MPEPSASTVHNAFALQGPVTLSEAHLPAAGSNVILSEAHLPTARSNVILSEACLPAARSNVILSEASRSLIARGAVEGPANHFAPATPSMVSNHRIYA